MCPVSLAHTTQEVILMATKIRKDKVKADPKELQNYESEPRIDKSNTPGGHSDKVRQTIQGDTSG